MAVGSDAPFGSLENDLAGSVIFGSSTRDSLKTGLAGAELSCFGDAPDVAVVVSGGLVEGASGRSAELASLAREISELFSTGPGVVVTDSAGRLLPEVSTRLIAGVSAATCPPLDSPNEPCDVDPSDAT